MTTLEHFQGNLFEEPTSLQEDSLASHSPQPESEKAETMNDISFRQCFKLFEMSDQHGSLLKTFAACLVSNLDEYSPKLSHRWKGKVTRSLRFVFLLQPSKPHTGEIDFGLLGTPTSTNRERSPETMKKCADFRKRNANQNTVPLYLGEQIAMIPTPRTRGLLGGSGSKQMMQDQVDSGQISAEDATGLMGVQMLPTPATRDYKGANGPEHLAKERGHHDQLPNAIAMLRTPTAAEAKNQDYSNQTYVQNQVAGAKAGLKLQPAFVEWMLGYPDGWTALSPSETVSSQSSPTRSSKQSKQRSK